MKKSQTVFPDATVAWLIRPSQVACARGEEDATRLACPATKWIAAEERLTLVDVAGVGLLAGLGALLLVTGGGGLLAGILLLGSLGGSGRGLGGGLLVSSLGSHFDWIF